MLRSPSMSAADFVLASSSPRRRALLQQLGLTFEIVPPDVDETQLAKEAPAAMVDRIARLKATTIDTELPVVAADTAVVLDGRVMGKPENPAAAHEMLALLSGRTHAVATGVAVRRGGSIRSSVVVADVTFTPMTPAEIEWYVGTEEPLDKAGAYGLGGIGNVFVRGIAGSHSTVMGLPLSQTVAMLRWAGVAVAGG